jgi:hypothetical protein
VTESAEFSSLEGEANGEDGPGVLGTLPTSDVETASHGIKSNQSRTLLFSSETNTETEKISFEIDTLRYLGRGREEPVEVGTSHGVFVKMNL